MSKEAMAVKDVSANYLVPAMNPDLPPGYKNTDVGVIPVDWKIRKIKDLNLDISDGNYSSKYPKAGDFRAFGVPFIRANNIKNMGVADEDMRFISEKQHSELLKGHLKSNDILITTRGEIGQIAVVPDAYVGANINAQIVRINAQGSAVYFKYLAYFLLSKDTRAKLQELQTGSALKQLPVGRLVTLDVVLPTKEEQRAIAAALLDVDALLAKLDALIAKKRDLKWAAMQQLLTGRIRLPGFGGEWEVKRLREIGDISSAGVDKKSRPGEVPVRLVNYLDVYRKDFIYSNDLNHWVTASPHQTKRCAVQKGDVFFTPSSETRGDIGMSAVAMEDIPDATYSYHVVRLRLRDKWDFRYRTYAFKTRAFLDQAETLCDGSGTRYVISQGKFKSMTVQVPPVPEQTTIAIVLSDMDAEIAALEARRDKTRVLKQGMMQELLTGRIRLVELETKPEVAMPAHDQLRKAANDGRNWAFNEAVIISVLAENFADASYPLGRMRYTKLSYLLHRYANEDTEGYLKKAAGPYNPATRYKGPERIAQTSGYVKAAKAGNLHGFVAGEQAYKARTYFDKWYGPTAALEWLRQFRYEKNEALELVTTVDKAVQELRSAGKEVTVQSVKEVLLGEPEWKPKLERPVFSAEHIQAAILRCQRLFGAG